MPRVLLVDHDVASARALARLLRDDGYEVDVATDGAIGVARLSAKVLPEVLITELVLPHASGLALARYARAQDPQLVVIFATLHPNLLNGHGLAPAPSVLPKPVDYAALAALLPIP